MSISLQDRMRLHSFEFDIMCALSCLVEGEGGFRACNFTVKGHFLGNLIQTNRHCYDKRKSSSDLVSLKTTCREISIGPLQCGSSRHVEKQEGTFPLVSADDRDENIRRITAE